MTATIEKKKSLRLDPVEFCRVVFQKCIPIPMSVSSAWVYLWRHNPNPREPFFAAELCSNFGLCKTGCKNSTNQLAGLQLVCPYDPLDDLRSHIGIPLARPLRRRGAHCSIYPFNDIGAYTGIPLARPLNRRKAKCYTPIQ